MNKVTRKAIKELTKKAGETPSSADALNFSQAACNLAQLEVLAAEAAQRNRSA